MSALTLRLSEKLDHQIRALAEQQQLTRSDFARRALENYVKQNQQELALAAMIKAATAIQASADLQNHEKEINHEFESTDMDLSVTLAESEPMDWWK